MDDKTKKIVHACIIFLQNYGYEVREREGNKIDKWVAYKKDGMNCVLHGKIIYDYVSCYCVKRKNSCTDIVGLDDIIDFFDSKKECYNIR